MATHDDTKKSSNKANILLVDDKPANLLALRALLEGLGENIIEVGSGADAFQRVQVDDFAVILLDVRMPGLSGFDTAALIRGQPRSRHTPIIFLTAADIDRPQLEEGYALGAVDFLVKPFVPLAVQAKVRQFIELFQEKQRAKLEAEQLRLLVHGTTDYAIFRLDPAGYIVSWNPGAERLKGYKAEEIIGQHFSHFYPQEAIDRGWPAHELEVAQAVGRFEDEGWRVRKDGSQFWANVVITALRDEAGNLLGFSKITRDMTERKKAEENARRLVEETTARRLAEENARLIQEQRERLHVTLASIGDAVISTDAEGRIDFLNAVAEELVGWKNNEATGRALLDVFHIVNETTRQSVENPALRALREGRIVGLANHSILISRNGAERPIDDSAAPIRDANGTVVGSVLVFRDITERKQAEAALRDSDARTAAELEAMTRLHALSTRLLASADLRAGLEDVLHEAIRVSRADFGNIQLYNSHSQALEIVVQSGFSKDFLEYFRTVRIDEGSACAQAMESGERIIIEDVSLDPSYEPHRRIAASAGYQAVQSTPLKNRKGTVIGMLSTHFRQPHRPSERDQRLLDLHARHAADFIERFNFEDALRRSEAEFRQLADAMPQIVWTAGADGIIDYSNRRWYEFTGLSKGAGNDGWEATIHNEDMPVATARWAECLRSGAPFEMELRLLDRRTGGYRWHLMRTVPVRNNAGIAIRWFGTATDINEQKRAADAAQFLAEASAALASLVDFESTLQKVANLAVPYFADWSAVDVAEKDDVLRRLAVAHKEPKKLQLAQELMHRYPPDPDAPTGIPQVLRTGQSVIVEEVTDEMLVKAARSEEHLRLIGSLGLRSYICVPLIVSGKPLGALTFATAESGRTYSRSDLSLAEDLSRRAAIAIENAQLYRELREEDTRKNEFLATLAHELRNPLAPLRTGLQVMKLATQSPEAVEQARTVMERQLSHLVRLVDDLLDVSRISRGKLDLRKERIKLATVVTDAAETCAPVLKQYGQELVMRLPDTPVYVDADRTRLAQAICNLVHNAAKYSDRGNRIWVTVERDGNEAVIRVKDNGVGIPGDMLPRVFDMFMQVDQSLEKSHGGLGIGLTIVKRLVELHGGSIEAKSEGHGMGSEFIMRLPIVLSLVQEQQEEGSVGQPRPTARHRILVVDDNMDAAGSLAMMLKLMGNEVRTAHDGLNGVETAAAFRPDLILLDIGMPKLNGYDACRRIRAQPWGRGVTIVALTGWGQDEDKRRSEQAGFDGHLVKPVEPAALEKLLAGLQSKTG